MPLEMRRRFFAEEIEAVCKLQSQRLVDAFAAVPRERFLPPGPWTVLAESTFGMSLPATRLTVDADPARVSHNIAVAIDPSRQLFNGQPGTVGLWIDALDLTPGKRVLHVGSGLGYFTALMAHCVGATGKVVAYEVDEALAAGARRNLAATPQVDIRHGDASQLDAGPFDAILVNAGVSHPLPQWLDALAPGGRMILPLTTSMAAMGSTIGKGLVFLIANDGGPSLAARTVGVVAIYSAVGLRDETLNDALAKAMTTGPMTWQGVKHLRRDTHEPDGRCWLHASGFCLSTT
jgi:protein-L-isoaspartate(D-aspartate) O-methyltransferase